MQSSGASEDDVIEYLHMCTDEEIELLVWQAKVIKEYTLPANAMMTSQEVMIKGAEVLRRYIK